MFQVFAADIFASKFCNDISNQHAGIEFRNKVTNDKGIPIFLQKYISHQYVSLQKCEVEKFSNEFHMKNCIIV